MYTLLLAKKAQKNLQKIDKRYQFRFQRAFEELKKDPFLGKPLWGEFQGYYSLRIGVYRMIYTIHHDRLVIVVVNVEHRQGVYK